MLELERREKTDPVEESNGSDVSYQKEKEKLFIEFFFFDAFIFQSRVKNFFAISVIEGAYYIANYRRKQQQRYKKRGEFNKYFPRKKRGEIFCLAISLIHIIEFLIVSRHSFRIVANLFWLQVRAGMEQMSNQELWHEMDGIFAKRRALAWCSDYFEIALGWLWERRSIAVATFSCANTRVIDDDVFYKLGDVFHRNKLLGISPS